MSERNRAFEKARADRRTLLKAGIGGICGLCLAGIPGCIDNQVDIEQPVAETGSRGFTRPMPSPWFQRIDDTTVRCDLCPKQCVLATGERSVCRVRENRDGVGYTLAYGNPALIQEDPIERKPFFHVLPGSWALSISTAGCNLGCKFCEVWDMALVYPEDVHAYDMPPEAVIDYAKATNLRSISYAFGEPVVFYEYMAAMAELAQEAGILNLVHTAGYIRPEPLKAISDRLDAANVDLKSFDPGFYRNIVGGELEPVLDTLRLLRDDGVHIEITNIVIPTLNDDMDTIGAMCHWIANELGTSVPIHFARFYPLYKLSNLPQTPVSTLDRARETALQAGLEYVYVARVTGHDGENTFCPGCGEVVINRVGFMIDELHLDTDSGQCQYCGWQIPGRWS